MDFGLTEQQSAIASFAEDLFLDHGDDERIRALYEQGQPFDDVLWAKAAEAGLLGLAVPEEFGGTGLGFTDLNPVLQQQGWLHHRPERAG